MNHINKNIIIYEAFQILSLSLLKIKKKWKSSIINETENHWFIKKYKMTGMQSLSTLKYKHGSQL